MNSITLQAIGVTTVIATTLMFGCKSNMTALQSEMSSNVKDALKGSYVLESVKVAAEDIDATAVSKAVFAASKDIFRGNTNNKQSLPVTISVTCSKTGANGGIATINNVLALCTLTIWPCVDADEYTYTVNARSVVGEHEVNFKVLNRSWFGLSPFAIIPVPGWADERGEESELVKFHIAQIAAWSKEACANLPTDYQTFMKEQPKYLEKIDQERSEAAYVSFVATKKAEALNGLTNEMVKKTHQNDLVAAFKNTGDTEVKSAILKKLTDDSFQKLPYDATLIPYWKKIKNERVLALIYRAGFDSLTDTDRMELAGRISSDNILTEMITAPSLRELRAEEQRKSELSKELREKISEATKMGENFKRFRRTQEEAKKYFAQAAQFQSQLDALNDTKVDSLFVTNANARSILYSKINPATLVKLANDKVETQSIQNWTEGDRENIFIATSMYKHIDDIQYRSDIASSILNKVATFSIRSDEDRKIADGIITEVCDRLNDDMIEGIIEQNRSLWKILYVRFKSKSRAPRIAIKYIDEARASRKESAIKTAFKQYGNAIDNDDMLVKLSLEESALRRAAFDEIKDTKNKEKVLVTLKEQLYKELKSITEKQEGLSQFTSEVNNGEELINLLKRKEKMNSLKYDDAFSKFKGKTIIVKGEIREVGKTMFEKQIFVSLTVGRLSVIERLNIQFNVSGMTAELAKSWNKGEVHTLRGCVNGFGDMMDDVECTGGEEISDGKFNEVINLKREMDCVKWQIKQIDENHAPPESNAPSKFGSAVRSAAELIKSGVDDIRSSGDDLRKAAETINALFN